MNPYKIQIFESIITLTIFLISKFIIRYFVKIKVLKTYLKITEKNDVLRLVNLILFVVLCIVIIVIWSVKQENILIVVSSLLTILGVGLFAEMSILSNITAYLILFFQHPLKIGDTITITHDGKDIEGELIEITYFFAFIKTIHLGTLTVPNAMLLKSSFMVK